MTPQEPALFFANAGFTYPNGVAALANIKINIEPGTFVSLIGPSGCGKSTLLRLAAGLSTTTTGSAVVFGLPPQQARRTREIGFVFQAPTLLPWRNAVDNAALPLELKGVGKIERRRMATETLKRVGLGEFLHAVPRELSGGMKMRNAIARALITKPDILLLDEPFGAIDEITREKLNSELLSLWEERRCTVLFVTHNLYEASFLSQRILVMSKRPGNILHDEQVPFAYPRNAALRSQPEFGAFTGRLNQILSKAAT